jgi:hypothetical protein
MQTERTEEWDKYRLQKRATQKAVRQAHWSYVNNVLESALEEGNSKVNRLGNTLSQSAQTLSALLE